MKLKVLIDNNTFIDQYYYGEPGVCYYIEDGSTKLLLDTGYSSIFLKNAELMNIDLGELDAVVLSHGHNDHVGGLPELLELRQSHCNGDKKLCLVAHPMALEPKYYEGDPIGISMTKEQLAKNCRVILTKDPLKLSDRITFLGQIPRTIEGGNPVGQVAADCLDSGEGGYRDDLLADDSALVYRGEEGIYIITGCSHSGICNIIERAKAVTGVDKVCGVIGGFHLFDVKSPEAAKTIEYLKEQEIPQLYPCHCVSFEVKCALAAANSSPVGDVGVGLELEWK